MPRLTALCSCAAGLTLALSPLAGWTSPPADFHGDPLPSGALARLGTLRLRHPHEVRHLAFAADGHSFASYGVTLCRWDTATGKPLGGNTAPGNYHVLLLLPGSRSLAVVTDVDQQTYLWDFAAGEKMPPLQHGTRTSSGPVLEDFHVFAASPDGKVLAGGSSGGQTGKCFIQLWEVQTGKELRQLKVLHSLERNQNAIYGLLFTPDGRSLLSFAWSLDPRANLVTVWDVATGKERHRFHIPVLARRPGASAAAIAADNRTLAIGLSDGVLQTRDLETGELRLQWQGHGEQSPGPVLALAFSPDSQALVSTGLDRMVRLWALAPRKLLRQWPHPGGEVSALAFAPAGRVLVTGDNHGMIRRWDPAAGTEINPVVSHARRLTEVAFAPDGRTVATLGWRDGVRLWETTTGRPLQTLETDRFLGGLSVRPDGRLLAWEQGGRALRRWDVRTDREERVLVGTAEQYLLAATPDGERVVTLGSDHGVRLWDVRSSKDRPQASHLPGLFSAQAAFTSDGKTLALAGTTTDSGGALTRIYLQDLATGRRREEIPSSRELVNLLAFGPDGRHLAVARLVVSARPFGAKGSPLGPPDSARVLQVWDVATGLQFPADPGLPGRDGTRRVQAVAFAPNGQMLAVAEPEGVIALYELATGQRRHEFVGHAWSVTTLVFSPDGRRLVSGSADLTALVWDLTSAGAPQLAAADLEACWLDLAGNDAARAFRSMQALAAAPHLALPLFEARLRSAGTDIEEQRLIQLVRDLDSERFKVRQVAETELAQLGTLAEPTLRQALQKPPSLEAARRIDRLLARLTDRLVAPPTAVQRRQLRSLEVLEMIATPQARQLLQRLAQGLPEARQTREARAAVERLERRASKP